MIILCHDLPEAVTGDIAKFEDVSNEEIARVADMILRFNICYIEPDDVPLNKKDILLGGDNYD